MRLIKSIIFGALLASSLYSRDIVNINISDIEIESFIKVVSKVIDKNIIINDALHGKVNFVSNKPVYKDEVFDILMNVLKDKGYTIIEKDSMMYVVKLTVATKENLSIINTDETTTGSMMVTTTLTIDGENVDIMASKIRHLVSANGKIISMNETNKLLITDYPSNIEAIRTVISQLYKKDKSDLEFIEIKHADIKTLHLKLLDIVKNLFNPTVATDAININISPDGKSLIIIGNEKNRNKLKDIISKMDNEENLNEIVQIFSLKNSDADSVIKVLKDIVDKQTYSDPSLKPNITSDKEINSIIIVGDPTVIKGIKIIIDELDKEKYQVYVQARIVEVNSQEAETIGLKYGLQGGMANSNGLYTFAGNFGGSSIAVDSKLSTPFLGNLADIQKLFAIGASLDFLQQEGASKTVSNPSLLCVNNLESSIYVGKTLSFQTGEASNSAGGTTNSFKREDIGLTLKVKPRVSDLKKVTIDVDIELENVIGTDSTGQPMTTKQTVNTQSILRSGESVVIGGLVKNYDKNMENKVPLLGDIPYLGKLFKNNDVENQQDNLLVILTPYVIESSDKLSELQSSLGELGKFQEDYDNKVFKTIREKKGK